MMTEIKQIGFVGLGNMGEPMAANLIRAGFNLHLYDINHVHKEAVADRIGGKACANWAELADKSELVITMLPSGETVREVFSGDAQDSLLAHLAPGAIVLDMSSSGPAGTRLLAQTLLERGIGFVDAPVSGGVPGAVSAALTIMAGAADDSLIDTLMPVFNALGKRVFRTGGHGSGHAMKALNNFVAAAAYTATAEALMIGESFGLDSRTMVDIFNMSTARSFNSEVVFAEQVVTGGFSTGFTLGLLAKDVGNADQLSRQLRVNAPVCRLVSKRWAAALQARGPDCDQSSALLAWRDDAFNEDADCEK